MSHIAEPMSSTENPTTQDPDFKHKMPSINYSDMQEISLSPPPYMTEVPAKPAKTPVNHRKWLRWLPWVVLLALLLTGTAIGAMFLGCHVKAQHELNEARMTVPVRSVTSVITGRIEVPIM